MTMIFLLTHPVWDVTQTQEELDLLEKFLLTHPVWDVTACGDSLCRDHKFLLTHPVWDVTNTMQDDEEDYNISTHTSRVGCDVTHYFNRK